MKNDKIKAGWLSLIIASSLAVESAIARLIPGTSASTSESVIICSLLAFSAAAFGISSYETKRRASKKN